nr:hypothetical protein [Tanacetum cinerariifolium]
MIIRKLKERIKSLSVNMNKDNVKKDVNEIETINIELDHRVSKLIAENEHLKQTYKQLYDSIKPTRKKGLIIAALKDELKKLKGKALVDNVVTLHTIAPEMLKIDVKLIAPRLLNNRTAHSDYLRLTQKQVVILREVIEGKSKNPLNISLDHACKYTKRIQELLIIIRQTSPSINNSSDKLVVVTPKNKDKRVRFTEHVTSLGNANTKTASSSNLVSNKPMLSSTGVKLSTRASGSQPSGNACLLTRIITPTKVPPRKPTSLETDTPKLVVTLVYSRKPRKSKTNVPVSKLKIIKSISANNKEPGVDLLTGSRGNNLYTLSLGDMMASSPICLFSKASNTKSWLWHRRLSHMNFGLPKIKFEKDHLCSACAMGKCKKKPHKPKSKDTNQEKLYLLHMDLYGPIRVASINGKKYILVIVDDYSRFTWVGIYHETYVACSPQQNGVVERRNRTLTKVARIVLIYAKASLFLWAEAVATACYTQNRSIIRLNHGKTPYELLHDKLPDLSFLIRIIETIHVDFDELTAMAFEHSSLEPAFHEMTLATISSVLVPNPSPSTLYVPPSRTDWDILFQPLFDNLLNPPPSVDLSAPEVITPIAEVLSLEPVVSTGPPSSTTVDQDVPSPSNS